MSRVRVSSPAPDLAYQGVSTKFWGWVGFLALLLVKRHMAARGSRQEEEQAKVNSGGSNWL